MLGDAAEPVDHVELAMLAPLIAREQPVLDLRGLDPGGKELEPLGTEVRIDEGLGGERSHPALRVRTERAHGKEAGGDGDAEGAALRVMRDDRPGHGGLPCPTPGARASRGPAGLPLRPAREGWRLGLARRPQAALAVGSLWTSPRRSSCTHIDFGWKARSKTGIDLCGSALPHMKMSKAAKPRSGQVWTLIWDSASTATPDTPPLGEK